MNYLMDILALGVCLFSLIYIIYGRMKNHSLIGGYKPGVPGYEAFRKLIRTRVLVMVCIATVVFGISTVFDARAILQSNSPHAILLAAPIGFIATLVIGLIITPILLKK